MQDRLRRQDKRQDICYLAAAGAETLPILFFILSNAYSFFNKSLLLLQ